LESWSGRSKQRIVTGSGLGSEGPSHDSEVHIAIGDGDAINAKS
jgi:hypothetical protein